MSQALVAHPRFEPPIQTHPSEEGMDLLDLHSCIVKFGMLCFLLS